MKALCTTSIVYVKSVWKKFEKYGVEGKRWQKKVDKEESEKLEWDWKKKVEKCEVNKKWG